MRPYPVSDARPAVIPAWPLLDDQLPGHRAAFAFEFQQMGNSGTLGLLKKPLSGLLMRTRQKPAARNRAVIRGLRVVPSAGTGNWATRTGFFNSPTLPYFRDLPESGLSTKRPPNVAMNDERGTINGRVHDELHRAPDCSSCGQNRAPLVE
jgi:hypothetical protein